MTQTARLYGSSLYDLAAEEHLSGTILGQIKEIREIFKENPDYLKLLSEPSISKAERIGLIEEAFGTQAERYVVNFIKLLCERGLLGDFAGCCEAFIQRYNADNGIAEAVVTSAVPLSDMQLSALRKKLESISGKNVDLTQKTDAAVIAGLRVELEGKLLDGTVHGRLSGISRKLDEMIV